jgi:hypothetical protein
MDNIEIQIHNEINDYKEKIYFLNFRQWIFTIITVATVIPTHFLLKDKIGEGVTSYIIIAIAGILGFIGFVKIHELAAEKIIPYWVRHYLFFAKPVKYITDKELLEMKQKKQRKAKKHKIKTKNKRKCKKRKAGRRAKSEEDELNEKILKLSKEQKQVLIELAED